jgi:D-alanyl-D-alanine carboxypeptidase
MMDFIACTDEDIPVQTGYGLGLRRLEIDGNTLIGHTGTIPGYGGLLMHNLEKNYSIAVLANISYLDQITILTELIDHLTDLIPSCP